MGIIGFLGGGLNYERLARKVNETLTSPITELKKALMSSLVIMATNPILEFHHTRCLSHEVILTSHTVFIQNSSRGYK